MCWNCDTAPAVRVWYGVELCPSCWEWALETNFWEMLGCAGELLELEERMMEIEVDHFRGILDAD